MKLPVPLLAVSDRDGLPERVSLQGWVRELGRAGVAALQVREKDLPDRAVYDIVRILLAVRPRPRKILVNGRIDIALAAGADGVHLPGDEISIAAARDRFGHEIVIGRSTHSIPEVERARQDGADYVTFGPIFPTPSKPRYGSPLGVDALRDAVGVGIPVIALGGVGPARFEELASQGAKGVAGIRMFQDPAGLPALVEAASLAFGGTT